MFHVISAMVDIVRKVQKKKKMLERIQLLWEVERACGETSKRYSQRDAIRGLQLMHFTYIHFLMIWATFIVCNRKWKRGFSSSGSWSSSTDSVSTLEKARLHFFFNCSEFCHTLKWNSHGFTCVPHPNPPSHLPLHLIPLGLPSAPGPSAVSCIQPGLVICFTLDNIHISMLFSWNIPPSPSPTESKRLFYTSVSLFLFCI